MYGSGSRTPMYGSQTPLHDGEWKWGGPPGSMGDTGRGLGALLGRGRDPGVIFWREGGGRSGHWGQGGWRWRRMGLRGRTEGADVAPTGRCRQPHATLRLTDPAARRQPHACPERCLGPQQPQHAFQVGAGGAGDQDSPTAGSLLTSTAPATSRRSWFGVLGRQRSPATGFQSPSCPGHCDNACLPSLGPTRTLSTASTMSPRPHRKATVAPPTRRPPATPTPHPHRSPSRTTPRPLARRPCECSLRPAPVCGFGAPQNLALGGESQPCGPRVGAGGGGGNLIPERLQTVVLAGKCAPRGPQTEAWS